MKKKIIIGIIVVILLICTYVTLILTKVLPNPFLDTKDLVCTRDSSNTSLNDKVIDEKVFKFDSWAKIESYDEKTIYTFLDEKIAKEEYEYAKSIKTDTVVLDKNKVTISRTHIIEEGIGYYGKIKEEIKKLYVGELGYECK